MHTDQLGLPQPCNTTSALSAMQGPAVSLSHVGAGCNRVVNALHWGVEGLLAYGAHNAVLIYQPEEARVLGTLLGHTDRVNCVRWLPAPAQHDGSSRVAALASGSGDGTVRIWQWSPGTPGQPWRLAATLQAHSAPVTSLTTLPLPGGCGLLLVSTAGDGEAAIWECSSAGSTAAEAAVAAASASPERSGSGCGGKHMSTANGTASSGGGGAGSVCIGGGLPLLEPGAWRLRQRIPLGHRLQDCAALAPLPADPDWLLLALGGVDAVVRLYLCPPGPAGQFAPVCQLAGHQDWVKGLAFAQLDDSKLLLASASQDKNVRVWAVQLQGGGQAAELEAGSGGGASGQGASNGNAASSSLSAPAAAPATASAALLTRYAPKPLIRTEQHEYIARLEALLIGHEDWVHSVAWHPRVAASRGEEGGAADGSAGSGGDGSIGSQPPCLLTASMDRTMMIWRPDSATGLWMCEESVGDAGANHLGYYTGLWSPDGRSIVAHGFTGALHMWRREGQGVGGTEPGRDGGGWLPAPALGGHYGPVVDACWAADRACLLTVSTDQTARITTRMADGHWSEIARPQVHGHDFSCVAALPLLLGAGDAGGGASGAQQQAERYLYASGSEEKVIRVFEAPRAFRDTLAMARGRAAGGQRRQQGAAALGALLPALGLSNKAVFEEDQEEQLAGGTAGDSRCGGSGTRGVLPTGGDAYAEGCDFAPHAAPSAVAGPPLEEHLAQNTLWPEVHKLYGHGNELYCLAADPRSRFLASACRAQSADAAAIWLWDTSKWTGAAQLPAHTLTVTQLAFSPDGRFLASASRDRTVAIFERQGEGQGQSGGGGTAGQAPEGFRLAGRIKAHARIVWALHWSPDSCLLATASRDGKVKIWSLAAAADATGAAAVPEAPVAIIDCGDSVRSVQFAPDCQPGAGYHLAAGMENGGLQLLRLAAEGATAQGQGQEQKQKQLQHELVWQAPLHEQHAAAVRRLCWRCEGEGEGEGQAAASPAAGAPRQYQQYQLASCSDDHALRVFSVTL